MALLINHSCTSVSYPLDEDNISDTQCEYRKCSFVEALGQENIYMQDIIIFRTLKRYQKLTMNDKTVTNNVLGKDTFQVI